MSPVYKKKKRRKHAGDPPLNTKAKWLILGAALACIAVIVAVSVSMSSGGDFKDISYIPRGEGMLFDNPPGDGTGSGGAGGGDLAAPPPDLADLPEEYRQPVPQNLSQEQKRAFIEKKYTYILNNLHDYYHWELRRLLQAAKSDYRAVKDGRKEISLAQLANEYLRAGRSLEKEADHNFAVIVEQMKSELKDNDLPLDIVKQAEKEYKEIKSRLRKDLLAQLEDRQP